MHAASALDYLTLERTQILRDFAHQAKKSAALNPQTLHSQTEPLVLLETNITIMRRLSVIMRGRAETKERELGPQLTVSIKNAAASLIDFKTCGGVFQSSGGHGTLVKGVSEVLAHTWFSSLSHLFAMI
jgi:hypothetical protein